MDAETIWTTLERLDAVQHGHFREGDEHADVALGSLDPLSDPVATEALAHELAEIVRTDAPDVILAMHGWTPLPGILVAFRAGAELGKPIIALSDEEGIVRASRPLYRGTKVALVGETFSTRDVSLARAHVEQAGASLGGVFALIDDGRAEGARGLVSFVGHRHASATCPMCKEGRPLTEPAAGSGAGRN
jgi:hypothetical protein